MKSARDLAESAAAQARAAAAEFEARVQAARSEIYREMDEKRRRALARRADLLAGDARQGGSGDCRGEEKP